MGWRAASWALAAALVVYPALARAQDGESTAAGMISLRDAVKMAVKASPDEQAAAARVARADAEEDIAVAGWLPRAEVGVRGGASAERGTFLFRQDHFVINSAHGEARAGLRWTVFDFGRTSNAASAAEATHASAKHGLEATRIGVARQAASAYVTVLADEQLVGSKKIAVKHRTRFAAIAKGLVAQGVRPALDEQRAKVNLEAARHDLAIAEARLAIDRARLAVMLGLEPSRLPPLAQVTLPGAEDDAARATAVGEKSRPEVAQANTEVEASDRRVDAARAGWLPRVDVDVNGSYRLTRFDFADGMIPRAEATGVVAITVPLFDATIPARVDAARADLAAAQAREERVRRQVRLEAYEAAVSLKAARTLKVRARELSSSAQQALALIDARYASGLATSIELVDAEQADLDAREALIGAELRVQLATVDLFAATGRTSELGVSPAAREGGV
ncbi:MAG: TolC family protein [Labilithrix sp.]|nr:TolC family protein [Labilithrix sp.]